MVMIENPFTHQKRDQFRNKPVFLFSKKSTDFQKL